MCPISSLQLTNRAYSCAKQHMTELLPCRSRHLAPPFLILSSTAHQAKAGDSHFWKTLKISMTSFLLHSLQPPASKPSNPSPSARPAMASLWGLGWPYLSYLGDWQAYVLWYIIYQAWLEPPFPLKMTKALSYSCLDLPCHLSSEAILWAVFLSCSMTFANKIGRAWSLKQKMLCFYIFILFFF